MKDQPIITRVEALIKAFNWSQFGFASLERPISLDVYKTWLEKGYQGDMDFLEAHLPAKEEPQALLAQAQSAIVVTHDYFPHPEPLPSTPSFREARVALYAQGKDYHFWLQERLSQLCEKLKQAFPQEQFLAMSDSRPVLERDLAYRAGLGWVGKNSCLIHPKRGSLFFIGEIYTTLELKTAEALMPDRCGKCRRCIDICPTEALTQDRQMDARKCISYLTIETKELPPEDLRSKMGDWLFGCDLCQTVCPWNEKAFGPVMKEKTHPPERNLQLLTEELRFILNSSNKALNKAFKESPLARAGGRGLRRTAIIIAANRRLTQLLPEIKDTGQRHPRLESLCHWAIEQLKTQADDKG